MDYFAPPLLMAVFFAVMGFAWHIAVLLFLYRIWQKVKHLPG
jgi:hypothetical protein